MPFLSNIETQVPWLPPSTHSHILTPYAISNVDMIDREEKFKFVDDLTLLEIVNLLMIGLSSFNIKSSVPSDIPVHNGFIPSEHFKTQE